MKNYASLLLIFALFFATGGAFASLPATISGAGTPADFTGIASRISGKVLVTQGNSFSIKVSGTPSAMAKLHTEVDGKNLVIFMDGHDAGESDLVVHVTMPAIASLSLAGSGDIIADNNWTIQHLEVSLAGSGDIILRKLDGDKLEASVAGSGDIIVVGGSVAQADLAVAGSGDISMEFLHIAACDASVAGSGNILLTADNTLDASIAGSGSIRFHGNPAVDHHVWGSGHIAAIK